jgi:hypothetical protein
MKTHGNAWYPWERLVSMGSLGVWFIGSIELAYFANYWESWVCGVFWGFVALCCVGRKLRSSTFLIKVRELTLQPFPHIRIIRHILVCHTTRTHSCVVGAHGYAL